MINRWNETIDKVTLNFQNTFGHLSVEQLNWKPNLKTWSIAQNLHHLIVINETYYPKIDAIRNGNHKLPFIANVGFIVRLLGNGILKSVQPDRKKKMKTFPIWEPSQSEIIPDILIRFEKHQRDLKQRIAECEDLVDAGTVISSPANFYIVYKLETAFDIIISHEKRHFEQAKEVLGLMKA